MHWVRLRLSLPHLLEHSVQGADESHSPKHLSPIVDERDHLFPGQSFRVVIVLSSAMRVILVLAYERDKRTRLTDDEHVSYLSTLNCRWD